MKVVLAAVNAKYIHSNLAVRYLKEYTRDLNYTCIISEFSINDREERVLEEIMKEKPDVVGFSCYIWNIDFVQHIANLIKRIDDSIQIIYGGPEVSYDCESFLKKNPGEFVIEGEGEETFREFIKYKLGEKQLASLRGLYYKSINTGEEEYKIGYNGPRTLMNMNSLVFPYPDEVQLGNKIVYYEASRGCPFNCKYCLSSTIHGVRFLDVERVKKELQYFMDKKIRLVKFVDRTFNCSSNYAREIWEFIINADTSTTFHFEISADILKMEDIELLKTAPPGRIQLEIGVQTTNNVVLENINRGIKFEDIKIRVESLKEMKNIKQHLDLIAGLPGEDMDSFRKSFNDVYSIQPEEVQLGFLKLLKGSSMREEAEKWGMSYSPYPPYEILKSRDISYEDLVKLKRVEEMVDKYYNSGKFGNILKYFVMRFSDPFSFYFELGMYFYEKGYLSRNISNADYYRVFLEFNDEKLKADNLFLGEVIKYDYLKYNKKKWLPDFLLREYDKKAENRIKNRLLNEGIIKEPDKVHIEKFRADVIKFTEESKCIVEDRYYMFDMEVSENVQDITDFNRLP